MTFKISVTTTKVPLDIDFNAPDAGLYQARLLLADGAAVAAQTSADVSFDFVGVSAGEYIVEMSRLDVNGGPIAGSVVTAPASAVETPAPAPTTKRVDVPGALVVTVTAE